MFAHADSVAIPMETTLFEVTGLSKRFGTIDALADVGFQVRAGEVLGTYRSERRRQVHPVRMPRRSVAVRQLARCSRAAGQSERGERSSLLFYVPDGIAPWPEQSVRWALDFTIGFPRRPGASSR
jgi:ABC-2 type transport system ATP-binding protein